MQSQHEHLRHTGFGKQHWLRRKAPAATISALLCAAVCVSQAPAATAAPASVTFTLSMQNPSIKISDAVTYDIVTAFEKLHPNIHIAVSGQPVDQHVATIEAAAETHTLPDVFWESPIQLPQLAQQGDLLNLAPIFKSLGITSEFAPSMLATYTLPNGFQYGMPYQPLVTGFFYNRALLKQYNVALPTTFDQLVAAAKVFSSHGLNTISQGALNSDFSVWAFLTCLQRFGYTAVYKQILAGKMSYDNPAFTNFYDDLQQLAKAGAFPSNMSTLTYAQSLSNFIAGKAVMVDAGVWATAQLQQSAIGNDVGFWVGPEFENGVGDQKVLMNVPSAPLAVSAAVKNNAPVLNAIEQYIKFYYSNTGQQLFVVNGQPPVTLYKPAVNPKTQPLFANILQQLRLPGWKAVLFQPDQPIPASVATAIFDSMDGIFENIYTPAQALQVVETAVKANLSA